MTSVLSKLIDKTSEKYGIQQKTMTRGVVAVVTTLYMIKLTYPYLIKIKKLKLQNIYDKNIINNNNNYKLNDEKFNNNINNSNNENNKNDKNINNSNNNIKKLDSDINNLGLNKIFLKQLLMLLKIMVPGWRSKETGLLICATITLLARTFISVYVATLEGQIVKRIVLKDISGFFKMLTRWFAIALPATFVNSVIRYLEGRLALSFRERLVKYAYKMYLSQQTYYRVSTLDNRLGGAEQRLTDDLSELASSVAHLYSSLTKPLLDCVLVGIALVSFSTKLGAKTVPGPLVAVGVIAITGQVLRLASPKFGQLVAEEASKRGRLREAHARISAHAEEIAFYGGHNAEHLYLSTAYRSLVVHIRKVLAVKLWYIMLEQFLMKYVWSGTGLFVIAMPLLYTNNKTVNSHVDGDGGVSERTRYLTTSKNLLSSGADAVERLMSSYKELVALAGYANRVSEMLNVFKDAALCKYQRTVINNKKITRITNNNNNDDNNNITKTIKQERKLEFNNGSPIIKGIVCDSLDGTIALDDVPIVTPNCEIIVQSLSIIIKPGDHLLITGPNGCGKSSLFRIISGLWPVYDGSLTRPGESYYLRTNRPAMFYIPQKPYMTIGCLREQITYPVQVKPDKKNDDILLKLLDLVDLRSLAEREPNGLDAIGDWDSTLSGGEKQRLAMTRLFYNTPQYALLDECTSAVSLEAEGSMYETAKNKGITLLTITHRVSSLAKYHNYVLKFDGEGGWNFGVLDKNNLTTNHHLKIDNDYKEEKNCQLPKIQEIRDLVTDENHIGIS